MWTYQCFMRVRIIVHKPIPFPKYKDHLACTKNESDFPGFI